MLYPTDGVEIGLLSWRKSRFSDTESTCVEVAELPGGGRAVRDSKNPEGGHLTFTATEWAAFTAGVTAGEFS